MTYLSDYSNFDCSLYANLVIGGSPSDIQSDYLNFSFQYVNIENVYSQYYDNSFTLNINYNFYFSIIGSCIKYNTLQQNVFYIISAAPSSFNFTDINLTNYLSNQFIGQFIQITVQSTCQLFVNNANFTVDSSSPNFNFLLANTSNAELSLNQAMISNIILDKTSLEYDKLMNTFIELNQFYSVVIENITIQYYTYNQFFFEITNVNLFNATNLYFYNVNCSACYAIYLTNGPS
jgi:hypothetical protein